MSQIKLNIETKTQKYPIYIGKKYLQIFLKLQNLIQLNLTDVF